ncbi:MAG: carboxypeptidase-like regulatory domain-containing protein [Bacteroidales bacterium]|jgi:hypothetical protein
MKLIIRISGLAFLLMASLSLQAQQVVITGRIIDRKTLDPIIAATITTAGSNGTITDANGRFAIKVDKLPATLSISHVSYGIQAITFSNPSDEVIIRLESRENRIPEVRVTANNNKNQVQILNRKARYTIIDYQFEGPYMWFIGCMDNSARGTRLYIGDPYGDTLCSVAVSGNVRLFRDFFGNVHLVRPDTVYQLFPTGDSIRMLYPESKEKFMRLMNSFEAAFGDGLVKLHYNANTDHLSMQYVDSTLKVPRGIYFDTRVEGNNYLEKRYAWIGRLWGPRTLNLMVSQQKVIYLLRMRSSLFAFHDTLYVVNLKDNQLHAFGKDLHEIRVVPISFYFKRADSMRDEYMPFRIILDQVRHQPYIVININNYIRIAPLNTQTGQMGPDLPLPRHYAMDKISIHDHTLYYIYPEKTFPYYQRLFRMELRSDILVSATSQNP